MASLLSTRHSA